jgi:hypothetical protein
MEQYKQQLAEQMLDSISKVNGFSDFGGIVLDYDLRYTTEATLKDVITAAMVEMYAAGAREATNVSLPTQEEILDKADEYGFRVPYDGSNNFYDDEAIKHFIAGANWVLATTTPLSSSSGDAPAGWISVNDRLPENSGWCNDTVLFFSKIHGMPMVGCYDYEFCNWTRQPWEKGYSELKFEEVTHWMPLPPMPNSTPERTRE